MLLHILGWIAVGLLGLDEHCSRSKWERESKQYAEDNQKDTYDNGKYTFYTLTGQKVLSHPATEEHRGKLCDYRNPSIVVKDYEVAYDQALAKYQRYNNNDFVVERRFGEPIFRERESGKYFTLVSDEMPYEAKFSNLQKFKKENYKIYYKLYIDDAIKAIEYKEYNYLSYDSYMDYIMENPSRRRELESKTNDLRPKYSLYAWGNTVWRLSYRYKREARRVKSMHTMVVYWNYINKIYNLPDRHDESQEYRNGKYAEAIIRTYKHWLVRHVDCQIITKEYRDYCGEEMRRITAEASRLSHTTYV